MGNRCSRPNPAADSTNDQTKKKNEPTELQPIPDQGNGTVPKEQSLVSSRKESPVFSDTVVEPWSGREGSVEQPQVTGTSVQADHEFAHLKQIIAEKDEEIASLRKQLHNKEQLIEEVEATVQTLKEKLIELQQSLQGKWTLKWIEKVEVPTDCTMQRGSATTVGGVAFFNLGDTNTVYAYENYSQDWKELPNCPHYSFTLVAVDGLLTAVGGSGQQEQTPGDTLLSFVKGEWTEKFPPMSMQRTSPAAVCTGQCLVVAGGCSGENENSIPSVEIMNTNTQQWHTAATNYPLWNCERIATSVSSSIAACGDNIYAFEGDDRTLSHVYTCSLSSLLQSCQQSSVHTNGISAIHTWNRLADLPVSQSTPVTLCGRLLSVGGHGDMEVVDAVYYYEPTTDTWQKMGTLICPQGLPLAASLPGDKLVVVHSNNNESFIGTSIVVEVS